MRLIQFPKISDERGNLTFLQHSESIPFEIERVFWTYDVPGGETRGGHAYKLQEEVIVALSGSFDVVIRNADGSEKSVSLNRSYEGLYLPALTWIHIENFSKNALSLHISSSPFDKKDYLRDFEIYSKMTK